MSRRCPYCDTDEDELPDSLENHVLRCQDIGLDI